MAEEPGAIILAGGQSSRMGQDKALLPYQGMTMLEHTIVTLLNIVSDIVIVTDRADRYQVPCGRIVTDMFPDSGPVGGILTGLTSLKPGSHIVVACDMPHLSVPVLQLLLKAATLEWDAVVPEINGQLQPLCAVYRHTAVPHVMRYLETGQRSACDLLKHLRTKRVGEGVLRRIVPHIEACFVNVNTPEDFANLRKTA